MVIFRFAVEELEAFYLADLRALRLAFPEFDQKEAKRYRPDSICKTWELFGRIVGDGGGNKVAWARAICPVLTVDPGKSRSPSFKQLCSGLEELAAAHGDAGPRRKPTKTKPRRAKRAVGKDRTGRRRW